jgi:hypothetical protein
MNLISAPVQMVVDQCTAACVPAPHLFLQVLDWCQLSRRKQAAALGKTLVVTQMYNAVRCKLLLMILFVLHQLVSLHIHASGAYTSVGLVSIILQ